MLYFKASPDDLDAEFVKSLYGDKLHSNATRLESFNRCPFYHFVRYGLMWRSARNTRSKEMTRALHTRYTG